MRMNTMVYFLMWVIAGFCGMEIFSYVVHRYIFHGLFWKVHKTHHNATHGAFEANDLFSIFFAAVAIGLMYLGMGDPLSSVAFAIGTGITVYGVLYFIIHDLFAHKRFIPFKSDSKMMRLIRRAHQRHHQSAEKPGQEPFGLFLFPYDKYPARERKREMGS